VVESERQDIISTGLQDAFATRRAEPSEACTCTPVLLVVPKSIIALLRPRLVQRIEKEKHCIRISVAFRLYLVKIIQILTN
jgi:hypothetical protein